MRVLRPLALGEVVVGEAFPLQWKIGGAIEAHFTTTGVPSQRNQSDSFRLKKSKRGILPVVEEQSRARGSKSGGVANQLQH